jgi:hypothetical protein
MKILFSALLLVFFAVAVAADKDTFKDRLIEFRSGNHGDNEVRMVRDALSYAL